MATMTLTEAPVKPTGILRDLVLTAVAPITWGTTYVVTTALLPPDRPMLAAALRALPAGLALLAVTRRLPQGIWWWRALVLGVLNFGAFFPLLFFAAYRLPGGVAATISAVQPLVVALFSLLILHVKPGRALLAAASAGTVGVGLLTLTAAAELDLLGIVAMLIATSLMGLSIVLAKKWGRPEGVSLLTLTGWQMAAGGLILAPATLLTEGIPGSLTTNNVLGYLWLGTVGAILAYALWFRGIERLPATSVSLLGLTNPLVATLAGLLILGQTLTPGQLLGFTIALASLIAGQRAMARTA
jgi:probable blue pigment (indigoidine) exporter